MLWDKIKHKNKLIKRKYETRCQLATLTEEQLKDIGITPEAAKQEVKKASLFWVILNFFSKQVRFQNSKRIKGS